MRNLSGVYDAGDGGRRHQSGYSFGNHGTYSQGHSEEQWEVAGGVFHHTAYGNASFYTGGATKMGLGSGYDRSFTHIRGTPSQNPGTGQVKNVLINSEPGGNGFTGGSASFSALNVTADQQTRRGHGGGYSSRGGSWVSYYFGYSQVAVTKGREGYASGAGYIEIRTVGGELTKGQSFQPGSRVMTRGNNRLDFQDNGDLVLRGANDQLLYVSGTHNRGHSLNFQGDGNLVIYDANGHPIWDTKTHGLGNSLAITDNAFQILDRFNNAVWGSDNRFMRYVGKGTQWAPGATMLQAGEFRLKFSEHGGLYIFRGASSRYLWRNNSQDKGGTSCRFNPDGKLWVLKNNLHSAWDTRPNSGEYLGLDHNGKFFLMNAQGVETHFIN